MAKKKGAKRTAKMPMAKKPTLRGIARDGEDAPRKRSAKKAAAGGKGKRTAEQSAGKRDIRQNDHADKPRANNPPVGLVTPTTDPPEPPKKTYAYDLHLDPQLVWAGKVQMVNIDPPYGINYGSDFQAFTRKRDVKDGQDEDLIESYRGSVSLPLAPGKYNRVAVKIVDERGIESLKVLELP